MLMSAGQMLGCCCILHCNNALAVLVEKLRYWSLGLSLADEAAPWIPAQQCERRGTKKTRLKSE